MARKNLAQSMMMALHMVAALDCVGGRPLDEVKEITHDAAMLGVDCVTSEKPGYLFPSVLISKEFFRYELLSWYYVNYAVALPEMLDMLNLPFSSVYAMVLSMRETGEE